MKQKLLMSLIAAAGISVFATSTMAQDDTAGYWKSQQAPAGSNVWKNSTGLCWRAGYWTPAMATSDCDSDLIKKEPKPEPQAPKEEPRPAPHVEAPAPAPEVVKITLSSTALFDFDKAVLKPGGKKALDSEVLSKLKALQSFEIVVVNGYTDTIGSPAYNQRLSERRAQAVRQYLVSQGIKGDQIQAKGHGEANPIAKCDHVKARAKKIACQAPNRRVEVEVRGQVVKQPN